jgi:UDP-N-acetylglucosamine diphosphorylase/glucosamine-1-phosphate N-acetyltransferase
MANIILFDPISNRESLLPFTFTRPVSEIRVGIFTIAEKWMNYFNSSVSYLTRPHLSIKYALKSTSDNILINGAICPDKELVDAIQKLEKWEILLKNNTILAIRTAKIENANELPQILKSFNKSIPFKREVTEIIHFWDIFKNNGSQIRADFELVKKQGISHKPDDEHSRFYNIKNIFIEEGVKIRASILNAENGPIYLGKNSEIQEGAMIRGPFALCENSTVNMGAKIRGDATVGPFSKVGGEISNSVIFGYSNKAHDGFLGNSVIGEWCNLGADTNTSNLKNNYSPIKIYNYPTNSLIDSGLTFCGLAMGDHSKCGINTMFNTGTVVGVNANIFGGNFPPKFISSFSWGESELSQIKFDFDKAIAIAEKVMERRLIKLSDTDKDILKWVFENGR